MATEYSWSSCRYDHTLSDVSGTRVGGLHAFRRHKLLGRQQKHTVAETHQHRYVLEITLYRLVALYQNNLDAQADIDKIKSWEMNSIRLLYTCASFDTPASTQYGYSVVQPDPNGVVRACVSAQVVGIKMTV